MQFEIDMDWVTQIGVGGIFAIMVIRTVMETVFGRKVNGIGNGTLKAIRNMEQKLSDMYDWHAPVRTKEGLEFPWYESSSQKVCDLLEKVIEEQREMKMAIRELKTECKYEHATIAKKK